MKPGQVVIYRGMREELQGERAIILKRNPVPWKDFVINFERFETDNPFINEDNRFSTHAWDCIKQEIRIADNSVRKLGGK